MDIFSILAAGAGANPYEIPGNKTSALPPEAMKYLLQQEPSQNVSVLGDVFYGRAPQITPFSATKLPAVVQHSDSAPFEEMLRHINARRAAAALRGMPPSQRGMYPVMASDASEADALNRAMPRGQ